MPAQELLDYIKTAREKKIADETIKSTLISNGWQEVDVNTALAPTSQVGNDIPLPPPPPVAHIGMWVGFLYILMFIALYILATAIGGIFHFWIDKLIPDPANSLGDVKSVFFDLVIPAYVAAIIVSFPIFAYLAIMLKKQLSKNLAIKNLRSRKILIYITLIGTFLIMTSNIIGTIYSFLTGTFTFNALGHLFITFIIAGYIFYYFLHEVKSDKTA